MELLALLNAVRVLCSGFCVLAARDIGNALKHSVENLLNLRRQFNFMVSAVRASVLDVPDCAVNIGKPLLKVVKSAFQP